MVWWFFFAGQGWFMICIFCSKVIGPPHPISHDMYIGKKRRSSRGFGERIVILCRSYVKGIIHQWDHLRLSLLNICWICLFLGSSPLMLMNMCRSLTICTESMISFLVRTPKRNTGRGRMILSFLRQAWPPSSCYGSFGECIIFHPQQITTNRRTDLQYARFS